MNESSKEQIAHWLREAPVVRGTLLRGVRFPDQTLLSDATAHDLPIGALEQAWRVVADTFQVLSAQRFPPTRLSWVYDRSVLHCVRRRDGAMLGVLLGRKSADTENAELNRLLTEFQNLELTSGDSSTGG